MSPTVMQAQYAFNSRFMHMLTNDIDPATAAEQPGDVPNHPLWIVGHLAFVSYAGAGLLDPSVAKPAGWSDLFGRGSTPSPNASSYPSLAEMISHYDASHETFGRALRDIDPAVYEQDAPEPFKNRFDTMGGVINFMTGPHEMFHLGQLSMWRRAKGFAPLI